MALPVTNIKLNLDTNRPNQNINRLTEEDYNKNIKDKIKSIQLDRNIENLDREEIKKILKNADLRFLRYLLSLVNLTDKELKAIYYVDMKGNTEEEAVEYIGRSRTTIQKYRQNAYKKIEIVWKDIL